MWRISTAPARINILGEHTDHHGGLALPFSSQHRLSLKATQRHSGFTGDETIVQLWKAAGGWPADLEVDSQIPMGAGMSSSAALCVAVVLCARGVGDKMETCLEAQRIEHEVLGSRCGLLDQIAITHSSRNKAVLIDFANLSVEPFQVPEDWFFQLVDTGIRRSLSDTPYGQTNISENAFTDHTFEESERVREALTCDARRLGELLNDSHHSLSSRILASSPAIDSMVRHIQDTPGVLGARLMGGGFGGMVLALVENREILAGTNVEVSESAVVEEEL